jgi:putative acetyltransferase
MIVIRAYEQADYAAVRELFVAVNRELAPPHLREAFEGYILRALAEEIDRIPAYYASSNGAFFVAHDGDRLLGNFGLEQHDAVSELRRMYVAASARRRGVGRLMLSRAEEIARSQGSTRLTLSTSELQQPALALYSNSGYRLVRQEAAMDQTNKTVGGGLKRYYFEKELP